ncbi:MAG: hypothetical protein U1E81_20290 [Xanthobacteraceae bacterium]
MNWMKASWPRTLGALAAVSVAAAIGMAGPTQARTDFDGEWSVVIVTSKGDCERSYRAPITISNGNFINVGVNMVDVSGNVRPDGKLTVRVSRGQSSAVGLGRLTATSGGGSWKGGACAGTWTAVRR